MPRKKLKRSNETDENTCKLCFSSCDDEAIFGKKINTESGVVHYFCLLFACGLEQKGNDDEGVFGFLEEDIRKEILRANKLKCTFCKKNTVASACAISSCRVKYHFNCGLYNNVLFHYFNEFPSYCVKHRPSLNQYENIDDELFCYICLEKFDIQNNDLKYQILLTSCCSKYLHIDCVKQQAFNAGLHFIKCPLCNDRDLYIKCAQEHGVYMPDEDAKWEEPQQWRDQAPYLKCDAIDCKCPFDDERLYVGEDQSEWEINICSTCGSYGIHTACASDRSIVEDEDFECPECFQMSKNKLKTNYMMMQHSENLSSPEIIELD